MDSLEHFETKFIVNRWEVIFGDKSKDRFIYVEIHNIKIDFVLFAKIWISFENILLCLPSKITPNPANIYLFKGSKRNTRK